MTKISQKETLSNAYKYGFTTKETIIKAYKQGFIWDYERDFLLEYFNV